MGRVSELLVRERTPPPGARPGTLALPSEAPRPRIRLFVYGADRLAEHDLEDLEELPALLERGPVVWVDVQGLGSASFLERLGSLLSLHPLGLADIAHAPQRPKIQVFGERHLIITRMAQTLEDGRIDLEQLSLVLGPHFVATFQEQPGDVFDPLRERLRQNVGVVRRMGADYLAYALIDAVVDSYFPVVEELGEHLEELEEAVIRAPARVGLAPIHRVRRVLLALHRVQRGQRDALAAMARDELSPFSTPVRLYLRDVHDHSIEVLDTVEVYREMAMGLLELHLSATSHRMNEVMKTLTVMATIFIPLTFLAGIYGMNFEHMPELGWRWGYPVAWGAMLAVAGALLLWFRRRGWIGGAGRDESEEP